MAPIVLKVVVVKAGITKAIQCDPSMTVYDTCQHIREKIPQASTDKPQRYGLFCAADDPTKGFWLDSGRTLQSYGLRSGSVLQYGSKYRMLRVLTLDDTLRTVLVDESLPLSLLTRNICAKIGLTNPQEFSFTVDDDTSQFTLRKQGHSKHDHTLDTMKRQLHIDNKLLWVSPSQTLRQQALLDSSVVLTLRKKLFFTDENVNSNDPVQLHLLFVQCREAILEGTHPVTKQEAIQLAALHLQAEFGSQRHNSGNFTKTMIKDVLPREYHREKAIDKLISMEQRKLYELSVLHAKFRYIELCRSLRTYGVSFFAVKEKTPGRNKLRPVLLGISRDGVLRLDKTTKALLQRWPLSTVKSIASTPTSLCLNFGSYESAHSEGVYVVKTSKGDAIVQLLNGYIHLILEAKPVAPIALPEGSVSPTEETFSPEEKEVQIKAISTSMLSEVEQSLGISIDTALAVISNCIDSLKSHKEFARHTKLSARLCEEQVVLCRHTLTSSLSSLLTHTAATVTLTNRHSTDIDYTQLQAAITALGMFVVGAVEACHRLAVLVADGGDGGERIVKEAQAISSAVVKLLRAAVPGNKVVGDMMSATSDLALHCEDLQILVGVVDSTYKPSPFPQVAEVVRSVGVLVESVRRLLETGHHDDTLLADLHLSTEAVESSCQSFAMSATVLLHHTSPSDTPSQHASTSVATGNMCISSTMCVNQMIDSCRYLALCVERLCLSIQSLTSAEPSLLREVGESSASLTHSLHSLIEAVSRGEGEREMVAMQDSHSSLVTMSKILQSPSDDIQLVLQQARSVAEASYSLMQSIRYFTHSVSEPGGRGRVAIIKALASSTTSMAVAAKAVATASGKRKEEKAGVAGAVRELAALATESVRPYLKASAISRLRLDSREVAEATTLLCAIIKATQDSPTRLSVQCGEAEGCVAEIVLLLQDRRWYEAGRDVEIVLIELINAVSSFIPVAAKVVSDVRRSSPTINDPSTETHLSNITQYTTNRLVSLRSSITKVSDLHGSEIDDLIISVVSGLVQSTHSLLEECRHTPQCPSSLSLLPTGSFTSAGQHLQSLLLPLTTDSSSPSLLTTYRKREIVQSLQRLTRTCHNVACQSEEAEKRVVILEALLTVLKSGQEVLVAAKAPMNHPDEPDFPPSIVHTVTNLSSSLTSLLSTAGLAGHPNQSLTQLIEKAKRREEREIFGKDFEKQVKDSVSDVKGMALILEKATEPFSNSSFHDTIHDIEANIQNLSKLLCVVSEASDARWHNVVSISKCICEIIEATAQAAYLVGAAHISNSPTSLPLIDQSKLLVSSHMISLSCQKLESSSGECTPSTVADVISRYSSVLCHISRRAAFLSTSPVTRCNCLWISECLDDTTTALLKGIEVCNKDTTCGTPTSTEVLVLDGEQKGEEEKKDSRSRKTDGEEAKNIVLQSLSQPLVAAIHHLKTCSLLAQCSASEAAISKEGIAAQEDILKPAQRTLSTSVSLVTSLAEGRGSVEESIQLGQSRSLVEELHDLLSAIRSASPGERECQNAVSTLSLLKTQLQQTLQQATDHNLTRVLSSTLPMFLKRIINVCFGIQSAVKSLKLSATSQAESLAREVIRFQAHCSKLVLATIGAASHMKTSDLQQNILEHTITVIENALQLMCVTKQTKGDPYNHEGYRDVTVSAGWMMVSLRDLQRLAEDALSQNGLISGISNEIIAIMSNAGVDHISGDKSTNEYFDQLIHSASTITEDLHNIITADHNPESFSPLCRSLTSSFSLLVSAAHGLAAGLTTQELSLELTGTVQSVGDSLLGFLQFSTHSQRFPADDRGRVVLSREVDTLERKLSQLVLLARQCVMGTHTTAQLLHTVKQLTSDVDMSVALAVAALRGKEEEKTEHFESHRGEILKAAKAVSVAIEDLVQKARDYGSGFYASEDSTDGGEESSIIHRFPARRDVVMTAQHTVTVLGNQTSLVKVAAAELGAEGNIEGQVLLLSAVRNIANALGEVLTLISSTHLLSTHSLSTPSAGTGLNISSLLSLSAEKAATANSWLASCVSEVGAASGSQDCCYVLKETVDYLNCSLEGMQKPIARPWKEATQSSLASATQTLLLATHQIVAAVKSCSSTDIVVSVTTSRSSMVELLGIIRDLAWKVDTEENRARVISCGCDTIKSYVALLEYMKTQIDGKDEKNVREVVREGTEGVQLHGKDDERLGELLEAVIYSIHELQLIASDTLDVGDYYATDSEISGQLRLFDNEATSDNLINRTTTEMTDLPYPSASCNEDFVQYISTTVTACRDLVQCVNDVHCQCVAVEVHNEERQWLHSLLHMASKLSSIASGLGDAVSIYTQHLTTNMRIVGICKEINAVASRVFMATSYQEAGSALFHQLQTSVEVLTKATHFLICCNEETYLYFEEDTEALLVSLVLPVTVAPTMTMSHSDSGESSTPTTI